MKTREDLLFELDNISKKIKKFRFPEFDGVYFRKYFDDILLNIFSDKDTAFSYVFGDINKLGIMNKLYGHAEGNRIIEKFVSILKETLPNNALISRLGGDEFSIILPNMNSSDAKKYIENINSILKSNANSMHDFSVEFAVKDSKHGNITKLAALTEKKVSDRKNARKQHDTQDDICSDNFIKLATPNNIDEEDIKKWKQLNSLINVSTYNFLQNIRPSDTLLFEQKQILDSSSFIISAYNYLLNKRTNCDDNKDLDSKLLSNALSFAEEEYNFYNIDVFNNFDPKKARAIHSLINSDINLSDTSNNTIKNISFIMVSLLNDLVKNPNSIFLSKPYFRLYLAEELSKIDKDYQAVFFSTSGIKLSNTAHDHSFTDFRLGKTADLFHEAFLKTRPFNNNPFECSENDIYLINHGAGDFLALLPMEKAMNGREINDILKYVNNFSNLKDPYSSFKMAANYENCINKSSTKNFIDSVRNLKNSANLQKDNLKKELLSSTDSLIAFEKTFSTPLNYYFDNIQNSKTDINKQSLVLKNIFKSFINFESLHNDHVKSNFNNNCDLSKNINNDLVNIEK